MTKFYSLIPLICEILGNMYIATVCNPDCDFTNFEANVIFVAVFPASPKSCYKNLNILRMKRAFKMK